MKREALDRLEVFKALLVIAYDRPRAIEVAGDLLAVLDYLHLVRLDIDPACRDILVGAGDGVLVGSPVLAIDGAVRRGVIEIHE